jgi:hypothetical protein
VIPGMVACDSCAGRPTYPPCVTCNGAGFVFPFVETPSTRPERVCLLLAGTDGLVGQQRLRLSSLVPFDQASIDDAIRSLVSDGWRPNVCLLFGRSVTLAELTAWVKENGGRAVEDHPACCGRVWLRGAA